MYVAGGVTIQGDYAARFLEPISILISPAAPKLSLPLMVPIDQRLAPYPAIIRQLQSKWILTPLPQMHLL